MYRFLVVAIFVAIAGLELTFPTTETAARVRAMLPDVQMASMLTPQTAAVAREAKTEPEPADLWQLRRVNDASADELLHIKHFHSGF